MKKFLVRGGITVTADATIALMKVMVRIGILSIQQLKNTNRPSYGVLEFDARMLGFNSMGEYFTHLKSVRGKKDEDRM